MTEMTLHTGLAGSCQVFHIEWFDHSNVQQRTELEVRIQERDKPRTLELVLNGVVVAIVPPKR